MPSTTLSSPTSRFRVRERATDALLAVTALAALAGCAASGGARPAASDTVPPASFDPAVATPITTREKFLRELGERPLYMVAKDAAAELRFEPDGALVGTLVRSGEPEQPIRLRWEWVDDTYCREGTIGEAQVTRACEGVTLYPGIGVRLDYRDVDRDDEYWTFRPARDAQ